MGYGGGDDKAVEQIEVWRMRMERQHAWSQEEQDSIRLVRTECPGRNQIGAGLWDETL